MSYRELIAEQRLLNALERGVLGDDTPPPPTPLVARAERGDCMACGRRNAGTYCDYCAAEDETGRRY